MQQSCHQCTSVQKSFPQLLLTELCFVLPLAAEQQSFTCSVAGDGVCALCL